MFFHFAKKVVFYLYNLLVIIKSNNVKVGYNARILFNTQLEGNNKIGENSVVGGKIGRCTYIGKDCHIIAELGRYTSISNNVNFINAKHPIRTYVSTSPVFYSLRKQCGISYVKEQKMREYDKLENSRYSVVVGNDVLISHGVTMVGALKIGDGAVIGAHSLVTKNIEPYTIVAGVPAKVIGKRFDDETINALNVFKWWDQDESWIKNNVDMFDNIDNFKSIIKPEPKGN
ncbi:MAG: CatB-related O-acetyltransferase [Candidatus Delongbacteria bacterium]|jgi:acetyltransferase-like isoleucine patch superfamily enzyme|nr:CatB-related O-acetyltransferase [Candidatus Delongbacteria bacterium]